MCRLVHLDREDWYAAAQGFLDLSYRQLWDYGALLADLRGAKSRPVVFFDRDTCIGVADIRTKSIPGIGGGLAFISFGPVCRTGNPNDSQNLKAILNCLVEEFAKKESMVLRIQPSFGDREWIEKQESIFREAGFKLQSNTRAYRTIQVPIQKTDDELRATLSKRWRRHLNQSLRKHIEVRCEVSAQPLSSMIEFHQEFIEKKGFQTDLGADFYSKVQERLPEGFRFLVSLAYVDGKLAAGNVESLLGDTMVYILGGRNELGTQTQASYLLHWKAIQTAREQGLRWYDTGGIDPDENPGVYTFKQGLGGEDLTTSGPWELIPGGFKGRIFKGLETLYRIKRNLMRG
ncbi:MAG: peptidoglycan bridge formation glycyltransferase FemA/FemB family protein [Candidatus Omnitrophica bacterium]|nr:peptidoglycan bridge formation glycyltransferase FemA/FemB family protein [Candidatus Omnitrophota bacterium]